MADTVAGMLIRSSRTKMGLTQVEIGKGLKSRRGENHLDRQGVYRLENGDAKVPLSHIDALGDLLFEGDRRRLYAAQKLDASGIGRRDVTAKEELADMCRLFDELYAAGDLPQHMLR